MSPDEPTAADARRTALHTLDRLVGTWAVSDRRGSAAAVSTRSRADPQHPGTPVPAAAAALSRPAGEDATADS